MNNDLKLKLMQNTYVASVAENVNTYEKLGVLEDVVKSKKARQRNSAKKLNETLDIKKVDEVFLSLSELFDCAIWSLEKDNDGIVATATACKLCALSKMMGGACPCNGWCLDPMEAMIKELDENLEFKVESTLHNGSCCKVMIK